MLKKRLAAFAASLAVALLPICTPLVVQAQGGNFGLDATVKAVNEGDGTEGDIYSTKSPEELIGTIVQRVLQFTGVIFFLLMLYAGIIWMTAQGEEKKVTQAKETIKAAVIGIVVIGAAYAITSFVLTNIAGNGT